jgi:tetratricopeptide (TPR) repeat protein
MKCRLLLVLCVLGCGPRAVVEEPSTPPGVEAKAFTGEWLRPPALDGDVRAKRERALNEARAAFDANPRDVDAAIWVGRRLGYLGRFRESVAVYTDALKQHPSDARLYRHRGHRLITLRQLDRAIADFERAAELRRGKADEVEPDGMPNAANIPTSTLHGNIYYHLALAHYLTADFAAAEPAWRACLETSTNDDNRVAAGYWLYITLARQGKTREASELLASLPAQPELLENHAYLALLRLFRGELRPDELSRKDDLDRVTIGYGIAMWRLLRSDRAGAAAELRAVVALGNWPAFGAAAAEAELARQ